MMKMGRIIRLNNHLMVMTSVAVLTACRRPDIQVEQVVRLPNLELSARTREGAQEMVVYRMTTSQAQLRPIIASGDNFGFIVFPCGDDRRRYTAQVFLEETPIGGWLNQEHRYDRPAFKNPPIQIKVKVPADLIGQNGCGRFESTLMGGFDVRTASNEITLPELSVK